MQAIVIVTSIISVLALLLAIVTARLERPINVGRDVLRIVLAATSIGAMSAITGVTTPIAAAAGAAALGLLAGVVQGLATEVREHDGRLWFRRGLLGAAVFIVGMIGMQAAGIGSRTGVFKVGQAIAIFSACSLVGVMIGRAPKARRPQPLASGLAGLVLLAMATASVSMLSAAPPAEAQDGGGAWVLIDSGTDGVGTSTWLDGQADAGGGFATHASCQGGDDGVFSTTWTWQGPPPEIAPGDVIDLRATVDSFASTWTASCNRSVQLLASTEGGLNAAQIGGDPFSGLSGTCDGPVCEWDPQSSGFNLIRLTAEVGSEGSQASFNWRLQQAGPQNAFTWTYRWDPTAGAAVAQPTPTAEPEPTTTPTAEPQPTATAAPEATEQPTSTPRPTSEPTEAEPTTSPTSPAEPTAAPPDATPPPTTGPTPGGGGGTLPPGNTTPDGDEITDDEAVAAALGALILIMVLSGLDLQEALSVAGLLLRQPGGLATLLRGDPLSLLSGGPGGTAPPPTGAMPGTTTPPGGLSQGDLGRIFPGPPGSNPVPGGSSAPAGPSPAPAGGPSTPPGPSPTPPGGTANPTAGTQTPPGGLDPDDLGGIYSPTPGGASGPTGAPTAAGGPTPTGGPPNSGSANTAGASTAPPADALSSQEVGDLYAPAAGTNAGSSTGAGTQFGSSGNQTGAGTGASASASGSSGQPPWDSEVVTENAHGGETVIRTNAHGTQTEVFDANGNLVHYEWETELAPGTSESATGPDDWYPSLEGSDRDGSGTIDQDEWWRRGKRPDGSSDPSTQIPVFPQSSTPPPTPTPGTVNTGTPNTGTPNTGAPTTGNMGTGNTGTPNTGNTGVTQPGAGAPSPGSQSQAPTASTPAAPTPIPTPGPPAEVHGRFEHGQTIGGTAYQTAVNDDGTVFIFRGDQWSQVGDDGTIDLADYGLGGDVLPPGVETTILDTTHPDFEGQLSDLEAAVSDREQGPQHPDVATERATLAADLDRQVPDSPLHTNEVTFAGRTFQVLRSADGSDRQRDTIEFTLATGETREITVAHAFWILEREQHPWP